MHGSSRKAFTLVEILVVTTIISLLVSFVAVSYASVSKSARDARRKTDVETIRAAIEQYRSNNGTYPVAPSLFTTCNNQGPISDASGTYLAAVPQDPKHTLEQYYCWATASDYTIGAWLENTTSTCAAPVPTCGLVPCNYCMGPYGAK